MAGTSRGSSRGRSRKKVVHETKPVLQERKEVLQETKQVLQGGKQEDRKKRTRRQENRRSEYAVWIAVYTGCFLVLGAVIWYPFYQEKRSLIWGYDGLYQTYTTMVYYSQYWRQVIRSLFLGEFSLPMIDTAVGLGFDVFTSLNHYGFSDPLELLALFFSEEHMEICYAVLAILRYYLAGLAFGTYGLYMKKSSLPVLAGALSYCFCGFALYAGVRHPYFMNSMIYFPLLLIGVEEILRKKKGYLLAIMVGIAGCSNFYFLYMLTLLTFSYAVIRFVFLYGYGYGYGYGMGEMREGRGEMGEGESEDSRFSQGWRAEFLRCLVSGCAWYLLGIGIAAVCLLPNILAFFGNARSSIASGFDNTWFAYPSAFYEQLMTGYVFPEYSAQYWCVLGYSPVVFLGILPLMKKKGLKKERWVRAWFVFLSALLLLPAGGYLMNGFSYVSHRWMYGYSFCMAWILVLGVERIRERTLKDACTYAGILACFCMLYLTAKRTLEGQGETLLIFLASCVPVFAVGVQVAKKKSKKTFGKMRQSRISWEQVGLLFCVVGTIITSASWLYQEEGMHYTAEFQEAGKALSQMQSPSEAQWKDEMESDAFYRVEGDTISDANFGMVTEINGTNPFFSIVGNDMYAYMKAMENPDAKFPNWYNGMGDRAAMMSLASVCYFTKRADSTMSVPFGYEEREVSDKGSLYESPYAMPLGYTYDTVMDEEEWETLSAIQKQQALMQAAVVDKKELEAYVEGESTSLFQEAEILLEEKVLPYQITQMEHVEWDSKSGRFTVKEGGGSINIEFSGEEGAETYVRICDFDTDGSGHELLYFFVGDMLGNEPKKIYVTSDLSVWDGKFKTYLTAVGNGTEPCEGATIRFPFAGTFHLGGIEVYSLPMEHFKRQAEARKEESFDGTLQGNRVKGEISVSKDKILCLSLPYSKGWKAKVDNEEVPVWKCNGMFLGVYLSEGTHEIEWMYQTPGMRMGGCLSLAAILCLLGCFYLQKKKGKDL